MKVFQIVDGFCYHYHPEYESAAEASQYFVPEFLFVDAPDWVHEQWGYDYDAQGDERFLCPPLEYTDAEGNVWVYDGGVGVEGTGTYYLKDQPPASGGSDLMEMFAAIERGLSD